MTSLDSQKLQQSIESSSVFAESILEEAGQVIVGQQVLLERLVLAFLCDGHVLLEGLPGLAKTLTIKTLADILDVSFNRIQFTPDLLPSDLVGTTIYNPKTGEFTPKKGPIFASLVLADEINRAPAKVQSALLEAMGERQVTIADTTYPLDSFFSVLATQNPIEQEGTYPLPEAQLDRFLFKVKVNYPTLQEERTILNRMSGSAIPKVKRICKAETILQARALCEQIYIDEKLKDYILRLVFASRFPAKHGLERMSRWIAVGCSPRATLSLARASRAQAFLKRRSYVTPGDVKSIAHDVLRHRLVLSFEAQAEGIDADKIVSELLENVQAP